MTPAERAARHVLGDLDDPSKPLPDVLSALLAKNHLSDGERVVAETAVGLWNGAGTATIGAILMWLDHDNLCRFAEALALIRPDVFAGPVRA